MDDIQQLWNEHLAARFPREITGKLISDYDAVMLDDDITGCVSTFLKSQRQLDESRILILQRCQQVLERSIDNLDGYSREYYQRLKTLAGFVLDEIDRPVTT